MIHVTLVDTETGCVQHAVGYDVVVVVREGPDDLVILCSERVDRESAVDVLEEAAEWLSVVGHEDDPEG